MRIKDFTDTIRHLTDSFNIPEARRTIQENPALTQEQFKVGGLVEPGVTHYGDKKPWETKQHGVPRGTGTSEQVALYARTTTGKKRLEAQKKGLVWDPKTNSMRKARKGGTPLGATTAKKGIVLTTPSKKELEIAEKVYSKNFDNKKGSELWKAIGKDKRASVISGATTGETGGWKIPVPEGKIEQKELIKMLGEEYNQKMKRNVFSQRVKGKKNYLSNKVAELLNRTEVPTKGKKVAYVWDKPTADQLDFIRNYIDSPHLMDRTIRNMRILDKEFGEILSQAADTEIGKKFFRDTFTVEKAKEALTKAGVKDISDAKAARAMTRLGQTYQDKLFKNEIGIGENKKTGEFIINSFNELDQYHPWRQASYNAALDDLKIVMGNKAGNLLGFKQTFKELMQKRYKNRKFVFNEVFSISTAANRGSYPYAYFVDLTEHAMNKGALATFQGKASIAEGKMQEAIRKYRRTGDIKHYNEAKRVRDVFNNSTRRLFLSSEKVLKYQKDYGIKPNALQLELGTAGQIKDRINFASNYYTTKNLNKWKDLGIDIDAHTGKSGYIKTFGKKDFVPKNVAIASELFTPETRFHKGAKKRIFDEKGLNKFLENNRTIIEALGCPGKKAAGGRVGFAETGSANCFNLGREKIKTGQIKPGAEESNFKKLIKAAKGVRGVARATGLGLAWEAAFAPIIVGWMGSQGESWERMKHELAYGPILEGLGVPAKYVPGESAEEELTKYMGKDAFDLSKIYEIYGKQEMVPAWDPSGKAERFQYTPGELTDLKAEEADAIYKSSKIGGEGYETQSLKQIRDQIKKREQEAIPLTGSFYEGPAGQHFAWDKLETADKALKKGLAELEEAKKARKEKSLLFGDRLDPTTEMLGLQAGGRVSYLDGGIVSLLKK